MELIVRPRSEALVSLLSLKGSLPSPQAPSNVWSASRSRDFSLPLASSAVALALAASSLHIALLGLISLLLSSLVFAPSFSSAFRSLKHDYRVDNEVLVASRLIIFISMNFYCVAALDAFLKTLASRLHGRSKSRYELRVLSWIASVMECRDGAGSVAQSDPFLSSESMRLLQVPMEKTNLDRLAARSADRMAPCMMGAFFLALPIYGANLAASFLMTSFGAHVRTLSPTTLRELLSRSMDQGVLIRNIDALVAFCERPTLVVDLAKVPDSEVMSTLMAWSHSKGTFTGAPAKGIGHVYFLASESDSYHRKLLCELAGDRLLVAGDRDSRNDQLNQLAESHGKVIYVGDAQESLRICSSRIVSVAVDSEVRMSTADVVMTTDLISGLASVLDAAKWHSKSGRYNWRTPVGCDCLDISTTLLAHFGVFYSTLFNYTGLLSGILVSKRGPQPIGNRQEIERSSDSPRHIGRPVMS